MEMKHIINSLPLVASVLSRKYGVNVIIGGDTAYTEGKNIHIPSLPITSDEHLLCLMRGYTDHESAHIRFTDFALLKKEKLDPFSFHVFNIIEDWRVENELAKLFIGSQKNLHYLIRYFFLENSERAGEKSPALLLLTYMLLMVRSWDIPEISKSKGVLQTLRLELEPIFQGLLDKIDVLLQEIKQKCQGTQGSIYYAKELVKLIKTHCLDLEKQIQEGDQNETQYPENTNEKTILQTALTELSQLLQANQKDLPLDLGQIMAETLTQNKSDKEYNATIIGEIDDCDVTTILAFEKKKALEMSIALRARLQGFLQSFVRQENAMARHGKLQPRSLYRTSIYNPKIFCRESTKKGINTAVHILLDASGSMEGVPLSMARQACYALGKVLQEIQGINPAITVFPANLHNNNSVYPLLEHGQKLTDITVQTGQGTTPLAPALWWAIRQMLFLKENRKIIFIITDGKPDCYRTTHDVINKAESLGFELYGIGIKDTSIQDILPKTSTVIMSITELVPSIFAMLQKALLKS